MLVTATHGGRRHQWEYEAYEGRTTIASDVAAAAGIETAVAGPGVIEESLLLYGVISPDVTRVREVKARFPGVIRSVSRQIGDTVRAGEPLATIESNESLQAYAVTAPIAGVITQRHAEPGEQARRRSALRDCGFLQRLGRAQRISTRSLIHEPRPTRRVERRRRRRGDRHVSYLAPIGDRNSQSLTARVVLDNVDGRWTPGQFVEGVVTLAEEPVELVVPLSALQTFREFDVVFARVGDTYEVRMVDLGRRDAEHAEVLGGLAAGTVYVTRTAISSRPTSRRPAQATITEPSGAFPETSMLERIIEQSIKNRWLVLIAVTFLGAFGVYNYFRLPIDAVPDITNVQVQINTTAPGYSPLETEQRITFAVETAMAGLPRLSIHALDLALRSVAGHGRLRGRHRHLLRAAARHRAPARGARDSAAGLEPELGPIATGLGEIFMFILSVRHGATQPDGKPYDTTDLHTVMDWIVRPQLARVPGVTEVNMIGGNERQYLVAPRPASMLAFGVTLDDLLEALERQQLERRRGLHRALRQSISRARARPDRHAR